MLHSCPPCTHAAYAVLHSWQGWSSAKYRSVRWSHPGRVPCRDTPHNLPCQHWHGQQAGTSAVLDADRQTHPAYDVSLAGDGTFLRRQCIPLRCTCASATAHAHTRANDCFLAAPAASAEADSSDRAPHNLRAAPRCARELHDAHALACKRSTALLVPGQAQVLRPV